MATSNFRRSSFIPGDLSRLVVWVVVVIGVVREGRGQQDCDSAFKTGRRLAIPAGSQCQLAPGAYTYSSVEVNGTLLATASGSSFVTVNADWMTVSSTGRVRSDGQGGGPGAGSGAGSSDGSGGAHGGRGGNPGGSFLTSSQSRPHGSLHTPVTSGGGGGGDNACGGKGGGALKLTLTTSLRVDGVITVQGHGGGAGRCGGGGGGSVQVVSSVLTGGGMILAGGGRGGSGGSGRGGGGGGGRVALSYNSSSFSGYTLAHGGLGGGTQALIPSLGQSVSSYTSGHSNGLLDPDRYPSRSWRPSSSPTPHFLELRPPTQQGYYVTALETRGGVTSTDYVTKYRVQIYDDTLKNWRVMLDEGYQEEMAGNTDQTTIVRRQLAYPVLTSKVRVLPLAWTGSVAMTARLYGYKAETEAEFIDLNLSPPLNGGAGGAGTVFLLQHGSPAVGELRLDNLAQKAGLRVTDSDIQVATTGAAGWLLDTTSQLDRIVLRHSAILNVDVNVDVSDVDSDITSLVYVSGGRRLQVGNRFDGNKFLADSAVLKLAVDSDVTVDKWSYIRGTLDIQGNTKLTVGGNMTLRPQPLTLDRLTVKEQAVLHVQDTSPFPLHLSSLRINGHFTAGRVQLSGLTSLTTGPRSNVTFDPVTSSTHLGGTVAIGGVLHLHQAVSFTNCSTLTIDGGALSWGGNDTVTLDCTNITVNGALTPGHSPLLFGPRVRDTAVGPGGKLVFRAGGPILTHTLAVSGHMEVTNKVTLQSPVQDRKKITVLVIHGPRGRLLLDTHNQSMVSAGQELSDPDHSELFVDVLTVGGLLDAGRLRFGERVTNVTVSNGGNVTMDAVNGLEVDYVTCHGVFTALSPLQVSGNSLIRTRTFHVGENGTVTLDATAQKAGTFSGVSSLVVEVMRVQGGVVRAGWLVNHQPPLQHGWNHLEVGPKGRLTFSPNDTFFLGYTEVAGVLESLTPITLRRPPAYQVNSNHLVVSSGGTVKLGVRASSLHPNDLRCGRLEIQTGGTMDVGYQKPTPGGREVSPLSLLTVSRVVVGGTLKGDGVKVVADDVSVGGQITAAGGGFLSNAGPGAGEASSTGASGASHGGRGGRGRTSAPYTRATRLPYGSIFQADTPGSGGGGSTAGSGNGGRGGGVIDMVVTGDFTVDGAVSVDGLDASAAHGGGGSGGSLRVRCSKFSGSGRLSSNGGSGGGGGGGGAGGRVFVNFTTGTFKSGHVSAYGGKGAEPGGPGLIYLHGDNIRNLRLDNHCQQPQVTEHGGTWADQAAYQSYTDTGGIAYLLPPSAGFRYDFTILEIYGGAHLTFAGNNTKVKAVQIVGDDTGHLHVAPGHVLDWKQESRYQRANMTWQLFLYRGAELILPAAPVEIRPPLTLPAPCPASLLRPSLLRLWGAVTGHRARLWIGSGQTVSMELSALRHVAFTSVTVQDGAHWTFTSHHGNTSDKWVVTMSSADARFQSHLTIEGGGTVTADALHLTTPRLQVDQSGVLTLNGRGLLEGPGQGTGSGGAGHGGRGDAGSTSGPVAGQIYGSVYQPGDFGSGGGRATNSSGRGGGVLKLSVSRTLIVEGRIQADGLGGSSGGSGGSIWIDTQDLEGSGMISVNGGSTGRTGGGGAGGRVAVYYRHVDWWFGSLTAYGGSSSASHAAAGTLVLKDSTPDVKNRTLIIDNGGRSLGYSMTNHSLYLADAGRTWLIDNSTSQWEDIRILGHAHFALHPSLVQPYELQSHVISGDNSGVLHVGPGQTMSFRLVDEIEAFTNVFIYEGGVLHLPSFFRCRDVIITVWGTLGIDQVEVSSGCRLLFGRQAHIAGQGWISPQGVLRVPTLTVADGGEVTVPPGLPNLDNRLTLQVDNLNVHGGGTIHAVHLNLTVVNLVIDDLGTIVGDLHTLPCSGGQGRSGAGASGAGHGGRGGRGSSQSATGHAHGSLFHPSSRGCGGGANSASHGGGRGGGVVYMKVTGTLHNDGVVRCDGEGGTSAAGGGSGGSILMEVQLIKGYGTFSVVGGNGSKSGSNVGGGGGGGRLALHFADNKTFAGDFDAYGGLADGGHSDGGPGTVFFYHTGYKHTTLLINNIGRGPHRNKNVVENYTDVENDAGRAWFLPHHGNTQFTVNNSYHFNELQIYGGAQLAVLTDPPGSPASLLFDNMIGDRTGAIHVGPNQTLDLQRPEIDLPFTVHVYPHGHLGLAPRTVIHGVDIFLNGTLTNVQNLTIHHGGTLWLFREGRTEKEPASSYVFDVVHVKTGGFLHMITDPVQESGINFRTIWFKIDGGGLARGAHFYLHTTNMSIDASGVLSADGLGYKYSDGTSRQGASVRRGRNGVINPGQGHTNGRVGSGAGHGGSGGRASEDGIQVGFPYGDMYQPEMLGSAGGGRGEGQGGAVCGSTSPTPSCSTAWSPPVDWTGR